MPTTERIDHTFLDQAKRPWRVLAEPELVWVLYWHPAHVKWVRLRLFRPEEDGWMLARKRLPPEQAELYHLVSSRHL